MGTLAANLLRSSGHGQMGWMDLSSHFRSICAKCHSEEGVEKALTGFGHLAKGKVVTLDLDGGKHEYQPEL